MKIIKEGNWNPRINCRACKTVMQVTGEDVRYGLYSENYEDEFKGQFYIECPTCEKKIIQKHVPSDVKEDAKTNRSD
jgi:DNA-directed RNA polymerase subunit RPC12/RpoP